MEFTPATQRIISEYAASTVSFYAFSPRSHTICWRNKQRPGEV